MRGWLVLLGACLGLLAAGSVLAQDQPTSPIRLSVSQAREAGLLAIQQGQPEVALHLSDAMLARDRDDPFAYFLRSAALTAQARLPEAQQAGRLAFRHAQSPEQRFQAARATALAAYGQKRLGAAQWWLRRAISFAPDDGRRQRSIAEFNSVRGKNPLSLVFRFSVSPSDNVNNGSSGEFNVIDGVPYVGTLSIDAQQLSGVIAETSIDLRYRVQQSPTSATSVGLVASLRGVRLSDASKSRLGNTAPPDLDAQLAEVSLRHSVLPQGAPYRLDLVATVGRRWHGTLDSQDLVRLTAGSSIALSKRSGFDLSVSTEQRSRISGNTAGDGVHSLRASVQHVLPTVGEISGTVFTSDYETSRFGHSSVTVGAELAFQPKEDFGPLRLSVNVGFQEAHFEDYSVAGLAVPGGRRDLRGYGEVQVLFPGMEVSGFAPQVSLRHQTTDSNVSRFDATETSLRFGVKSTF